MGITVSVGLRRNKFLAKIASDLDKPRGFSVIGRAEAKAFLAPRPVTTIFGVGAAFSEKLAADGIRTVGDLQGQDATSLARRYGAMGLRLAKLAQGEDDRRVDPSHERKSVAPRRPSTPTSRTTRRSGRPPAARREGLGASEGRRLAGNTITLKLKTAAFKTLTRARKLTDPTQLADRIFQTADDLLDAKRRARPTG